MKIKLTEGQINTPLVVAVGILAAIMVMGIGSHAAFASKSSLQDGYNAGFAAGKKDRINGNDYDSNPNGHSGAYDENYRHGYDDGWFRGEHHFSSNSAAAASSGAAAVGNDDGGHNHKNKDSAAASSSSSAAAGGGGSSASSSSSAAASSGSAAASSSSAASS
jgi:cobaltochelatase CobN